MRLLADASGAQVYCAAWRELAAVVESCDALIVDAPYSARTHAGHEHAVDQANQYGRERDGERVGHGRRRVISYDSWSAGEVCSFVHEWAPRVRGWFVSVTDHVLAPVWSQALEETGRYVFAPIAYVAPGSRVRLLGDGPSNWSCWIVVARPRTRAFAKWGTLPGAYVLPPGQGGAMPVVGGKPLWLMQRLVEDYSRRGDLVVDPCCGAGTTAIAAALTGRRAVAGDALLAHAELAARWVLNPTMPAPGLDAGAAGPVRQLSLLGGQA